MCGGSESGQREKELFTHRAPVTAPHCSAIFWLGIRSRSQTQPPAPARVAIPLPVSLSLLAPVAAHRLFLAWDPPAYFFLLFFFSFSSSFWTLRALPVPLFNVRTAEPTTFRSEEEACACVVSPGRRNVLSVPPPALKPKRRPPRQQRQTGFP